VNIRALEILKPLPNFIVSFSLSPASMARAIDLRTPSIPARLQAMRTLADKGHKIAAHFDPLIYKQSFREDYADLLRNMESFAPKIDYLSLGVVRFTKDVYREVERNYPDSLIHTTPMLKSFDQKVRYHRPMRLWMMNAVKDLAIQHGVRPEAIYLCMEEHA
jgi:spore photoproduct lyase